MKREECSGSDDSEDEKIIKYERRKRPNYFEGVVGKKKLKIGELSGKPRELLLSTNVFPYEWKEKKKFYGKFCGLLTKKIEKKSYPLSTKDLIREKTMIFPTEGLPVWDKYDVCFIDCDGQPLLYFLKQGLKRPLEKDPTEQGLFALDKFVTLSPPNPPKHDDPRHRGIAHKHGYGVHHLALWHAVGHDHEPGVISHDIKVIGEKLNYATQFFQDFTPVTQAIGALVECIDSSNYERYKDLFNKYVTIKGAAKVMSTSQRSCFMGLTLLTGLCVGPHRDSRDALDGWVADMAFGEFEGGLLEIPQLKCSFLMKQGDVVFFRSALLQHSISKTLSGKRYGVVAFTHQANFLEKFDQ